MDDWYMWVETTKELNKMFYKLKRWNRQNESEHWETGDYKMTTYIDTAPNSWLRLETAK